MLSPKIPNRNAHKRIQNQKSADEERCPLFSSSMKSDRFFLNQSRADASSHYEEYSRSKFLQDVCEKEDVNCIVFGTYRVEKTCFESEFLNNIDNNNLPILVLHGRRPLDEEEGDRSSDWAAQIPFQNDQDDKLSIWEVLPSFKCSDNSFQLTFGCHHPKYLLIFTSEGMHISISTSNLTSTASVDGTWTQFFPKCQIDPSIEPNCDFGMVLEDFLQKESENLRHNLDNKISLNDPESYNILRWIEKYTKVSSITHGYQFDDAEVDLVTTVPCRQPLPALSEEEVEWLYRHHRIDTAYRKPEPCVKCRHEQTKILSSSEISIEYSSFRVNSIVKKREREFPRPLKSSDFLIAQPTSIGGLMNNQYVASWLETLMPDQYWLQYPEKLRQDSWRLIWPSNTYMEEVKLDVMTNSKKVIIKTENKPQDNNNKDDITSTSTATIAEDPIGVVLRTGIVFLNPKIFALMEPDIQSAFHTYEPNSIPSLQLQWKKVPHIKTYTRLMQGIQTSVEKLRNIHVVPHCICWKVAWCWLTSACLSKGAQGEEIPYSICSDCRNVRQGYREFKNFELGILFRSTKTRQYLALNNACPVCTRAKPFQKITATRENDRKPNGNESRYSSFGIVPKRYSPIQNITLPLPFNLSNAKPYCNSQGKLVIDPYFHEDLQLKNQLAGSKSDVNSVVIAKKPRQFSLPNLSTTADLLETTMNGPKRKLADTILTTAMKKAHTVAPILPTRTLATCCEVVDLVSDNTMNENSIAMESQASVQSVVLATSKPSPTTPTSTLTVTNANECEEKDEIICSTPNHPVIISIPTIATIPQYHTMIRHTSPSLSPLSPEQVGKPSASSSSNISPISYPSTTVSVNKKLSFAFRLSNVDNKRQTTAIACSPLSNNNAMSLLNRLPHNNNENNASESNSLALLTEESVVILV